MTPYRYTTAQMTSVTEIPPHAAPADRQSREFHWEGALSSWTRHEVESLPHGRKKVRDRLAGGYAGGGVNGTFGWTETRSR